MRWCSNNLLVIDESIEENGSVAAAERPLRWRVGQGMAIYKMLREGAFDADAVKAMTKRKSACVLHSKSLIAKTH